MSELIMQCLVCGILLVAVWICLPEQVLFWILAVVALFGAICLNDKKRQNKTDKKSILTLEAIRQIYRDAQKQNQVKRIEVLKTTSGQKYDIAVTSYDWSNQKVNVMHKVVDDLSPDIQERFERSNPFTLMSFSYL